MEKLCALTFDDGPSDTTLALLELFKKYDCTASFFVIGNRAVKNPDIMRKAVEAGCTIENHTWAHTTLTSQTPDEMLQAFHATQDVIREAVGELPMFCRAPGCRVDDTVYETIPLPFMRGSCGSADWNSNPDDPVTSDLETRVAGILKVARDGQIYLHHDCAGNHLTPDALAIALPQLIDQGYRFVNLRELFRRRGVVPQGHAKMQWDCVL
ncbi:MAG: polysaccharide deacetylase family protein [Clostridia bacterium]|nr:polysaccharide deacetylase family protein [Clostridia bacterium]